MLLTIFAYFALINLSQASQNHVVETPRVYMRMLTQDDESVIANLLKDKYTSKELQIFGLSKVKISDQIQKFVDLIHQNKAYIWIGFDKANNNFTGIEAFTKIKTVDNKLQAELVGFIDKHYRKSKLSVEATISLLDYAFNKLSIDEVIVHTNAANFPVIRLMRRLGATQKGMKYSPPYTTDRFIYEYVLTKENFKK